MSIQSSAKHACAGVVVGDNLPVPSISSDINDLPDEVLEKILIEVVIHGRCLSSDISDLILSDECKRLGQVCDRWEAIVGGPSFLRRVKQTFFKRHATERYLNEKYVMEEKLADDEEQLHQQTDLVQLITLTNNNVYIIFKGFFEVLKLAKYRDAAEGDHQYANVAFSGLHKIRHPSCMVASPDDRVLFILDADITLFADRVCRVQIETGKIDKTWTVDQGACSLSMTSQGHLTLGWWDQVTEYSNSGHQLRTSKIPCARNMDVVEASPMPSGREYLIWYRGAGGPTSKFRDRLVLRKLDQAGNKRSYAKTYTPPRYQYISCCKVDDYGCVLLMNRIEDGCGLRLMVSKPGTFEFVKVLFTMWVNFHSLDENKYEFWVTSGNRGLIVWNQRINILRELPIELATF